jgi:phosphate:Na+ symporter
MYISPDIWKMLAGIAIFILGMNFLEEGLRSLTGRSFKLFLRKQTSRKLKGILGGAAVTAVLQSSSIVNLMVLAFTGAGIITMQNALAVILGSNLGTTISSWIIATLGFKLNIENFSLPIVAIAGILMMLSQKESKLHHWCRFLFGFGFLFLGLGFIRSGMEETVAQFDLRVLEKQPVIIYLIAGFIITSLIQSSSATVAIILSALYAQAISLYAAMALVLGSEIGTTIKLVIAAVGGLPVKKRVALGNLLFNIINTAIILVFLSPIHIFITQTVGIGDRLLALVFFQSLVNLIGIILFYPFLGAFGKFLEKQFASAGQTTLFIHKTPVAETGLAMEALEKEIRHLVYRVLAFVMSSFEKKYPVPEASVALNENDGTPGEQYEYIKQLHGQIHQYSLLLLQASGNNDHSRKISRLIASCRNAMYAAKNIKDALPDIDQLRKSSNDLKYRFYLHTGERVETFCHDITTLMKSNSHIAAFEKLTGIYKSAQAGYRKTLEEIYQQGALKSLTEIEFSTVVNFNREMFTMEKSIVFALKDCLLTEEQAAYFDEMPGFIR